MKGMGIYEQGVATLEDSYRGTGRSQYQTPSKQCTCFRDNISENSSEQRHFVLRNSRTNLEMATPSSVGLSS
jgi:hypothetical protein